MAFNWDLGQYWALIGKLSQPAKFQRLTHMNVKVTHINAIDQMVLEVEVEVNQDFRTDLLTLKHVPGMFQAHSRHVPCREFKFLFYLKVFNLIGFRVCMMLHEKFKNFDELINIIDPICENIEIFHYSFQDIHMVPKISAQQESFLAVNILLIKSDFYIIWFKCPFHN